MCETWWLGLFCGIMSPFSYREWQKGRETRAGRTCLYQEENRQLLNGNRMHCRLVILIQCRRCEAVGSAGNRDCRKAVLWDINRDWSEWMDIEQHIWAIILLVTQQHYRINISAYTLKDVGDRSRVCCLSHSRRSHYCISFFFFSIR
jgi:hypothetical protein